ncbi:MAG: TonB-dependent receptor [Prevotella sp.]|nr:TonB-dependent receptor [Prevotella sp.]MBQ9261972.1 TonB-dependent receptor [Prevotella sp.]
MKLKLRRVSLTLMMILLATIASAQSELRGVVVDQEGEPVIGASVLVVGAKVATGTVTDFDGNFILKANPGAKLRISFVGYKTVTVDAKNGMRVILEEESTMLKGVEIVAYGVQKKVTVTGALSSVKSEDLTRTPVSSVNNVLAGQLSGVTTVQYSGEPGSDAATIYVRGQGTWADSAPLIQVDGVERSMADIDPEDIESITVLKDASATAVFGVRGANGVVLITTKRGQEGKAKIDITTSFSALTPTKMLENADSYEYGTFFNQMQRNDFDFSSGETFTPMFSDELLQKFKDGSDPIRFPNMRWSDYIMKNLTMQTKHNVNISGGTKNMRYFVSAGLMTQGGLFEEFGDDFHYDYRYNRFNYRTNLDLDVTPTTTLSFNVAGTVDNAQKPRTSQGASGMIMAMTQSTPFSSPGIIDGKQVATTTDYTDGINMPFIGGSAMTYYNSGGTGGYYHYNNNKLQMDLQLQQKLDMITKGLLFKIKGSYNSLFSVTKGGTVGRATYNPVIQNDGTIAYRKSGEDTPVSYSEDTGKARDWYFETSLNYNRSFGLHTVTGLVLYNQSKEYYPSSGSWSDIPRGYVGLVGRVTYDWNNRYMAEFNIGYNGSENFHPDRRYGIFPAGSVGWVVSDEPFFKPIKDVVSFMKLRASWGLVGNDKIGGSRFMYLSDPYIYNTTMAARGGYAYNFGIENSNLYAAYYEDVNNKNNPEVTWEKAFKQDYGIDIQFLNNRLRATFDYYKEHRTDILLRDYTAPSIVGFLPPYANMGIVDSWGWELSLKWNDKIGSDFRYWATVNISHNQNEIIEKKEAPLNNEYQYEKGHRIGSRYMYQFFRYYDADTPRLYEETFGKPFPKQLVDLVDGDAVFVDLDGNGYIDGNDKTRDLGYTDDPEFLAGLNAGFAWKDFEFNMQWTAAWNVSRVISDVFRYPFLDRTTKDRGGLLKYHLDNTWNPENPGQDYEYPRASWSHGEVNNYQDCALYEKDAKYLRLKTLMIAYNMHFPFLKKLGINRAQLALSGYNLLTFTPYIWGDPETRASTSPSYPLQRTYTASLKLNF